MNELIAKYGGMVFTFVIWIAVFYFLLILPNKKKQKKHDEMLNSLKEGAEVLTSGGIKGTVSSISPEYIVIRVDKGVNLTVKRSSIVTILK
ncbi:MAG: preprotein translocase subunit YajC [Fusobacteriaceae bacterium]